MRISYGVKELAERLGISEWYARQLMRAEGFPSFRIGKLWKVDENDLVRWIQEKRSEFKW